MKASAIGRLASIAVIIVIMVAAFAGYGLGTLRASTVTSTLNQTITPEPKTTTVVESLPNGTITEVIIEMTGTQGGGGFCQGSSPNSCVGMATIHLISSVSTSYIVPSIADYYFNASVMTTTSYGTITCTGATTSFTTATENSTYVFIEYTWTASC